MQQGLRDEETVLLGLVVLLWRKMHLYGQLCGRRGPVSKLEAQFAMGAQKQW